MKILFRLPKSPLKKVQFSEEKHEITSSKTFDLLDSNIGTLSILNSKKRLINDSINNAINNYSDLQLGRRSQQLGMVKFLE